MALESRFDFEVTISPYAEKKDGDGKKDPKGAGDALDAFFAKQVSK